ncbi:Cobalamin biosynthesis protein BluB @ 5,6-dimethylbenzimidazole synthase, flavin destructase family [Caballeronia glathei]|uniref:Cob(II)yrinic acid a,c-diamide reductase n=1 Tax=Caballeronia glathei TaxID=60547 RepID=A0A069PSW5_9BURK|nr:5,6-dimethylbenzimidazole synthase [Caballeronia glathei]KDR42959.1 cob(II)yrinic acid a,c-diamide reductase [Caballeronia glathei]CDY75380.1 Cobalamin biosynthesis protein BluB @ 5,6-dimethylbenzimidazole synthase, flavin destructase family [Caballeronia glathei]
MTDPTPHRFSDAEIAAVYRAIYERRDMRHFTAAPVAPEQLARLLDAAHHGPSVGFMQPWRFVRVTDRALRVALHGIVEKERLATAQALNERGDEFMRLKVQGILDCGEVLVAGLMENRERHIFGRRTMPEMDLASVACAIQNLWLAARAEGLGLGWVSLFDVGEVQRLLGMPAGAKPVAILCVGHVERFYDEPMLQTEGWAKRMPVALCADENSWPAAAPDTAR